VLSFDDNQKTAMQVKAKKQAAKFTWDICADKTVEIFNKAMIK